MPTQFREPVEKIATVLERTSRNPGSIEDLQKYRATQLADS